MLNGGYEQFCPVAKAAELLTRRWTPLVVRELICGSHRFNDIRRGVPRMSPSLLARRLRELEEVGVVERRQRGDADHAEYHLTAAGRELEPVIMQMGIWGRRWLQREISRDDLDAGLLMWDIRRRLRSDRLPDRQVVLHFHFVDAPKEVSDFWLVLNGEEADLCAKDPGHPIDLEITSDVRTLTQVWMGDVRYGDALATEALAVSGPTSLRRAFPGWLGLSLFAQVEKPAG